MTFYPCIKIMFNLIIDFLMPSLFFLFYHRLPPYLMALLSDFAAPTRYIAVLFLTSNMLVKICSDLIALGFFMLFLSHSN